ncbi:MAG: succinate dehydrogenase, cytochrome b556 subunit [Legionellales bacterium]|nr:succinate dehydrogenase, cytochrome b556 subunit [Legionellales bacterium]|tara:strand:- start:548 stop:922 length:375 start_codon:yes stop_codon:yes gene_type:complete
MAVDKRPVFLNLFKIRFPVTALVSIAHRVSGIVMVLALPGWLWVLQSILGPEAGYQSMLSTLHQYAVLVWVSLMALVMHLLAGLRHLVMDMGWGESLCAARASAWLIGGLAASCAVMFGVMLWV